MLSLDTWMFLAGLGLFLYGISLMEQLTKKMAGRSFKLFLRKNTNSLPKSVLGGMVITGLLQSSSVIILMLMSFVGAGIISFRNALGVVIGSNLGTTIDSWFIATIGFTFNLQLYSLPIIAITAIGMFFTERRKELYNALYFIFSIGIMLLGFGFMKDGAGQLALQFNIAAYSGVAAVWMVLAGFLLTVLIQSSSATVAIALTALHVNAVSLPAAACLVLGSETGTTIKILLASIGGTRNKLMLAAGDFIFNLFTTLLFFILLQPVIRLITNDIGIGEPMIALVFFQSFINLVSIILVFPFIQPFSAWIEKLLSRKGPVNETGFNNEMPVIPELAPVLIHKAAHDLIGMVLAFHKKNFGLTDNANAKKRLSKLRDFTRVHGTTDRQYLLIKETEGNILGYFNRVQDNGLTNEQSEIINACLKAIRETIHAAKSIHDIRQDLRLFKASTNDFLYKQFDALKNDWADFEDKYTKAFSPENGKTGAALDTLLESSKKKFRSGSMHMETNLEQLGLSSMEVATLLNVYHEILSSKKALIKAATELRKYQSETTV